MGKSVKTSGGDPNRNKRLFEYEKVQIDEKRANGLTTSQIAREIDKSWDSVNRYITKRDKYGSKNSTGRPAKLSQRSKRYIKKILDNNVTNLTDIKQCLEMHDIVKVSKTTIWNYVQLLEYIKPGVFKNFRS